MKLTRRAALINLPAKNFSEIKINSFRWDEENSILLLKGISNHDFHGPSKHRYEIEISIDEFEKLISEFAASSLKNPSYFEKNFGKLHKDFFKITSILGGIFVKI